MKKSLAILAASMALVVGAQAGTVTYSFDYPMEVTEIKQTGSLGMFDPSMGTLTGVALTFKGSNSIDLSLTNRTVQPQLVDATTGTKFFFGSTLGSLEDLIHSANPVLVLTADTGLVSLEAGQTSMFPGLADNDSITWTSSLDSILNDFVMAGGGAFDLGCQSLSNLTVGGGGGNVSSTQNTKAQCGVSITYTFDDAPPSTNVPEPTAPALVGIAILGLWATRRRKS